VGFITRRHSLEIGARYKRLSCLPTFLSSRNMPPTLPLELILHIVTFLPAISTPFLHSSDAELQQIGSDGYYLRNQTLHSLALQSRAFADLFLPEFREVLEIFSAGSSMGDQKMFKRRLRRLARNPRKMESIRCATLVSDHAIESSMISSTVNVILPTVAFLESLTSFLSTVPNPRTLQILYVHQLSSIPSLRSDLIPSLPTIKQLTLHTSCPSFLRRCSEVEHVRFIGDPVKDLLRKVFEVHIKERVVDLKGRAGIECRTVVHKEVKKMEFSEEQVVDNGDYFGECTFSFESLCSLLYLHLRF
jgi:hypothetical protein